MHGNDDGWLDDCRRAGRPLRIEVALADGGPPATDRKNRNVDAASQLLHRVEQIRVAGNVDPGGGRLDEVPVRRSATADLPAATVVRGLRGGHLDVADAEGALGSELLGIPETVAGQ
jgi:hypothetical protein